MRTVKAPLEGAESTRLYNSYGAGGSPADATAGAIAP